MLTRAPPRGVEVGRTPVLWFRAGVHVAWRGAWVRGVFRGGGCEAVECLDSASSAACSHGWTNALTSTPRLCDAEVGGRTATDGVVASTVVASAHDGTGHMDSKERDG